MARQALTIGGFLVGAAFGQPGLGTAIGSALGGIVDPVKIEGPRLTDAKAMTSRDGVPIPWGDGIFRVAGTMIACQPGKPTEHKKKKRQGKGGGPVQVTYTYTRSHAVLICEGEIVGVRRIWRNGKLVYDATPIPTAADEPNPTTLAARVKAAIESKAASAKFTFTLYVGNETQLPDPTLEAMFGVGEVGANRGIAYIVIEDDDVTDTGGAVPQYEFEVARAGVISVTDVNLVAHWPLNDTDDVARDVSGNGHNGTWLAAASPANPFTRGSSGSAFCTGGGGVQVPHNAAFDVGSTTAWGVGCSFDYTNSVIDPTQDKLLFGNPNNLSFGYFNWYMYIRASDMTLRGYFTVSGGSEEITGPVIDPNETNRAWLVRDGLSQIIYLNGEEVARQTLPNNNVALYAGSQPIIIGNGWTSFTPTNTSWEGPISDCMIVSGAPSPDYIVYDHLRFSALTEGGFDPIEVPDAPGYYVDQDGVFPGSTITISAVEQDTVTLDEFITTICLRCGLEASDIDVTDVAGIPVTGYFIARQAGGDTCLKPLLDAFQIGMYEADGKIWFVQLGADTVADLDADDLVALDGPPVTETRAQEIELPRKINVIYSDPATAYTPTKQTSERVTSDVAAVGEVSIELPVVMTADQAAQIAHKKEKAAWIGLLGGKEFALPDEFSYLTPTDNINLTYRGRTERVRLEKVDAENGQLMLSTQQDRQSAYSSERTGTSPDDFFVADTLVGPTIWSVMNLPQLRPQDNVPGVYFACCGLLEGWRGCELQMSVDSGVSWIALQQYDQPSAIGYLAASMLSGATTGSVTMYGQGELESVTTAQVDAGSNRAAIVTSADVAEVVSFEDAALDSFGDYDLAAMTRALLATPAAAHAANERFVHLDNINFVPIGVEYAGQAITFRAVSLGTAESNNGEQTLTFTPAIRVIDGGGA